MHMLMIEDFLVWIHICGCIYRGADKTLARLGRKQAAPVKSMMGRVMD